MSYLVNKTDGTLIATVLDGQTDNTATSVILIGKQVTNYGELQNENFVHIMENFSNSIDPPQPLGGQLWWNSAAKTMQVFDATIWRPVTGFTSANSAPSNSYVGDQWYDATNQQYKVYNGTSWLTVGPAYSVLDGISGAIVENVYDTGLNKHTIVKVYHNGNVTAIINRDAAFTPNVTIGGFTTVQPGISFTSAVDAIKLYGTATNSDTLGNLTPSQFLRSDVDAIGTGRLSIQNQVDIGLNNELNIRINGLGQALVKNIANNGDIILQSNAAGVTKSGLTLRGSDGRLLTAYDPIDNLGLVTKQYSDIAVATLHDSVVDFIATNVAALTNTITVVQANLTAANSAISSLDTLKAPLVSPAFTGTPTAPTPTVGDISSNVATAGFVASAISNLDPTMIYNGTSYVKVNSANVSLVVSGTTVMTALSTGMTTITQASGDNTTKVATTAFVDRGIKNFVLNSTKYQPTCYVSSLTPDNNTGADGDFWFQYT